MRELFAIKLAFNSHRNLRSDELCKLEIERIVSADFLAPEIQRPKVLMGSAQRQATHRFNVLVSQDLSGREAMILIEVVNDDWFLRAPDVAIDRFFDRHLCGLSADQLSRMASFKKIRPHHVLVGLMEQHGQIAKRKKILQTASYVVEEF